MAVCRRFVRSAAVLAVVVMASTAVGAGAEVPVTLAAGAGNVPLPVVSTPVSGGVRTGMPQASAIYDLVRYGYTEKEYFVEGTATSPDVVPTEYSLPDTGPPVSPGTKARYKTRMIVILPPRERFNGWAMVEWANVTFQQDVMFAASELHDYLMREGYAMVFVSAQKQGVDGAPTSLRSWDPVRYGSLVHPGDAYSFDIFSQAMAAVRAGPIDVPVATYAGNDCRPTIMGSTHKFDPARLASLYPTHDDYVEKMAAATGNALARGWMLQPEATEMMSWAKAAPIPS